MKILLASLGTRGDMEPFLAVGELLKRRGHEIVCLMPEQFGPLAEESGFKFKSLGSEFIDMLESEDGKAALGGSAGTLQKVIAYTKLARQYKSVSTLLLQRQYEAIEAERPERIVHHAKAIYPYLRSLQHPGKTVLLSPVPYVVHETREFSHVMFNRNLGPTLNKVTYALARFGLIKTIATAARKLEGYPPISHRQIKQVLLGNPAVYTISPTLFPRPPYWPQQVKVLGYHERDKTLAWKPDKELLDFMARHPKFLLITFGSMTNPEPENKTTMVLSALEALQIPAIINTAGGGLQKPDGFKTSSIHFVKGIPYDWIFPKTYAVVHHGGSGTTHMALKYGCASMIVPHIIDQYLWNTIGDKKGVGPKGPSITALKERTLRPLLEDLWQNPEYKAAAAQVASGMAKEDFEEELVRTVVS